MSAAVRTVRPEDVGSLLPSLVALLTDAVDGGASLGFHPPLDPLEAAAYWRTVATELAAGSRLLVVAEAEGEVVGSGQLVLPSLPNARHRAELQKLCVLSSRRGRGIGHALMDALHEAALRNGRSLILLNTRRSEYPETFYRGLGYTAVGVVPRYTLARQGERHDTVILYRDLSSGCADPGASSGEAVTVAPRRSVR